MLLSCHVCHPSLCNDNLSGISVAVTLARLLASVSRRFTYRFLFIPGTIGCNHVARAQRGHRRTHQTRAGARVRRRPRHRDLQTQP